MKLNDFNINITPQVLRGSVWLASSLMGMLMVYLGKDPTQVVLLASTVAGGLGVLIKDDSSLDISLSEPSSLRGLVWIMTSLLGWVMLAQGKDILPVILLGSSIAGSLGVVMKDTN